MPLLQIDCKEIQALVRKKGIEALGGYRSIAYNDNSLRGKVYSDIQQQIRREFGVLRYEAIKRSQLEMAKEIIINYKVPLVLENEIKLLNGNKVYVYISKSPVIQHNCQFNQDLKVAKFLNEKLKEFYK